MIKSLRIAAIATPLVLTASTVGIYLAVASKKTEENQTVRHSHQEGSSSQPKDIYENFKIFPDLDQHDFYKDIKIIDSKGKDDMGLTIMKAIIDDEMKAKIINYVLRNMATTEGKISYGYGKGKKAGSFNFYFKWKNGDENKAHYRTYKFSLSQST